MTSETEEHRKRRGSSGLVFAACMFVGLGIGFVTGYMPGALLIGMGAGFGAMAAVRYKLGEW